ncbi:MAG: pilus assembly protein PilM [Patescibacteria group bacterium]|nr:pilus assembly protein PilM [Patescibacteria group bacterium]
MFSKFFRLISKIVLPKIVVVGLDIQDRHIGAVVTTRRGGKFTKVASNIIELPDEAIEDGEIRAPKVILETVKNLLSGIEKDFPLFKKLDNEPIFVLSVPPNHIYTETMVLPLMNEADLHEAVRLKIETSLPWPLGDTYFDWVRVPLKDHNRAGIFMAAIQKNILDDYLKIFAEGGWLVSACEFHLLSLAAFIHGGDEPFIFILIDEDGAEFAIFNYGKIISHYLQRVRIKEDIAGILNEKIKHLTAFAEGNLGVSLQKVYILDRANLESTLANLEDETKMSVGLVAPPSQIDERLFIANGASQREYGGEEKTLNLVPPESSGRYNENLFLKTLNLWTNILIIFSLTFIIAFFSILAFTKTQTTSLLKTSIPLRASLDQQFNQAQPLLNEASKFNVLAGILRDNMPVRSLFGEKFRILQNEANLTGLTLSRLSYVKAGEFNVSFSAPTRTSVLYFKEKIEKTEIFSEVIIPSNQLTPEKNLSINATIKI